MSQGMIIDGVFASEAIDSSGEILDIKGCDISDLENGQGVLNWEHRGDDAHGASANDIIGKVVFAKKIYSAEDCTDARQLEYWQKVQLPMIYGIVRLFDGSGHPGAVAAAAIIRDYKENNEPLLVRYSIEGTTLKKDKGSNRLLESVARRVAATIKPCNKSCASGVIADPNAGKLPVAETKKAEVEHPHPNFTPLGGSFEYESGIVESETIRKALEAGSTNAAPGALVGGAALQREDASLRNRVKAAVRDWDRKEPFKKFLKHRLPEASNEFIDRFGDLVHDVTLKKMQANALKITLVKKVQEKVAAKVAAPAPAQPGEAPLSIRGQQLPPNPEVVTHFDERKGIMHTPRGSFPMYIPSRDKAQPDAGKTFHAIMQDPKIEKFHDYAMENWSKLHQHLKAGSLPPEVIMHGVLFSQLSPNTPVPMQELMYSHLVDAMRHTGTDPRSPKGLKDLRADWLRRDQPQLWPEHSRDHFRRLEDQLRMKNDSKGTGRVTGDIGGFMLANNKFKNMSEYHKLHGPLVELIGRHKHDARSGVEEMMAHKKASKLWEAKRARDIDKGKGDPGEYTAGPDIPGLAPKTARYTYGMLGGGNVVVPDTHFVRYLFGLDRQKDGSTIDYIKGLLWNPHNTHVLNGIDRYYAKHHDAVKHMLAHPRWGSVFEKPEDAVFPAFWKNWVGILPHEAARGMKTNGWNESTDHRPFWEAVGPYLRKAEELGIDTNLVKRTANQHHEWVKKYGEMPALMMYYRYLVPQLLEPSEKRLVQKFESTMVDLAKAAEAVQVHEPAPEPETVNFNGKTVKPGKAYGFKGANENYYLVDHTSDHFVGVPAKKIFGWQADDLVKLPRKEGGRSYRVVQHPEYLEPSSIVSHEVHGLPEYNHHQEQKDLIHGLDMAGSKEASEMGITRLHGSHWAKNAQGKRVFVKAEQADREVNHGEFGESNREVLYHNLAKDFYGLGNYVVPTAAFISPRTGQRMSVVEHQPMEHFDWENSAGNYDKHVATLHQLRDSGELDKLAIMNAINHNTDRHQYNYGFTPEGSIKLIDHGRTFTDSSSAPGFEPHYLEVSRDIGVGFGDRPLHPAAAKWLQSLSPTELDQQMRRHGVPEGVIDETRRRLVNMQQHARRPTTIDKTLGSPFYTTWGA